MYCTRMYSIIMVYTMYSIQMYSIILGVHYVQYIYVLYYDIIQGVHYVQYTNALYYPRCTLCTVH